MGNGNKVEMLIAICAVLTSAIAVFIAWDQGRVMRAQQHGAVFPILQLDGYVSVTNEGKSIGLTFANSGVGPAIVRSVEVSRNGEKIDSLSPYRDRLPEETDVSWMSMTGRAIAAGEKLAALRIAFTSEDFTLDQLYETADEWDELSFKACYCSVFDRCWTVTDDPGVLPEQTKECTRDDQDVFEGLSSTSRPAAQPQTSAEVE